MDNMELSTWLWDRTVRVEKILMLAGVDAEAMPSELKDFFDEHTDEELAKVFGFNVVLPSDEEDDDSFRRVLAWERLVDHRMQGLLVLIESPVKKYRGRVAEYSWGLCHMEWFYVENLGDDFRTKVDAFVAECEASDKRAAAKAAAKSK